MSVVHRDITADVEQVWSVLADGWLYPLFVVGASRIREVDADWPSPGANLHHSVGSWPVLLDDSTSVLDAEPPHLLSLRARGWPAGAAGVTFRLSERDGGTRVELEEDAVSGPGTLVPSLVRQPMLTWRNTETLRRLAYLAERRAS